MATISVVSYPDNEINYSVDAGDSLDSAEIIKYCWIDLSETTTDTYVEVTYNSVITTLYIQEPCKYDTYTVMFQNKEGALQAIDFMKEFTESIRVDNEQYESNANQPSDGYHQFVRYNVNGKEKIKINSGFREATENEAFKQLMLSERVWFYDGTTWTPVNISSSSLEYKTRRKDKLINYEIEFEYSYNEINTI